MEPYHWFNLFLLLTMGVSLALALSSQALQNRFVASEPLVALAAGVVAGPFVLDIARLEELSGDPNSLLEQISRVTLAIAIVTAALRVGWRWVRGHLRELALILFVGLPAMWASSYLALELALGLSLLPMLLVAAIVTPTDPVLAQAVLTSEAAERNVPERLRRLISCESAANDGLALVLVMVPVLLIEGTGAAFAGELLYVVFWEVLAALVAGAAAGLLLGWILRGIGDRWATEAGLLTVSVLLALVTLAGARLINMDGLFGVFGAGIGLSAMIGQERQAQHADFSHAIARLFHLPLLVLLGAALPLAEWREIGWPLLLGVVLVLLFRRLPVLLLLAPLLRPVQGLPSAIFAGWFGPIGIAALFYATLAVERLGDHQAFVVVTAIVTGSVVAHGLSDTVGAKWLGRARGAHG